MSINLEDIKILVAENISALGDIIQTVLRPEKENKIFLARNSSHALLNYQIHKHDLIIIDLDLNTDGGIALTKKIRAETPDVPVILMASYANQEAIDKAKEIEINDLLIKPFSFDDLMKHINYVMN
ncbi:MAG: response regulator [Alphaproteobacteria bacterium]|nr:response regulator [Alphaproteobacteria bacterium]